MKEKLTGLVFWLRDWWRWRGEERVMLTNAGRELLQSWMQDDSSKQE